MTSSLLDVAAQLDRLQSKVGTELGVTDLERFTQAQVDEYAALTGEDLWVHTDPVRAASSPYGGTIVQATLLIARFGAWIRHTGPWLPEPASALNASGSEASTSNWGKYAALQSPKVAQSDGTAPVMNLGTGRDADAVADRRADQTHRRTDLHPDRDLMSRGRRMCRRADPPVVGPVRDHSGCAGRLAVGANRENKWPSNSLRNGKLPEIGRPPPAACLYPESP